MPLFVCLFPISCRWTKGHDLLVESGINQADLQKAVEQAGVYLRYDTAGLYLACINIMEESTQ